MTNSAHKAPKPYWPLGCFLITALVLALPVCFFAIYEAQRAELFPLHKAAAADDPDTVKSLLAQGTPVDQRSTDQHLTPLHCAANAGAPAAAKVLIDAHADLNARGPNGLTPLHLTMITTGYRGMSATFGFDGRLTVATELLDAGADPNAPDDDGNTPLHAAIMDNRPDIAKLLLAHGANPALKNRQHHTPADILFMVTDPAAAKDFRDLLTSTPSTIPTIATP